MAAERTAAPQEVAASQGAHSGGRQVAQRAARLLDYTTMGKWLAVPKEEGVAKRVAVARATGGRNR